MLHMICANLKSGDCHSGRAVPPFGAPKKKRRLAVTVIAVALVLVAVVVFFVGRSGEPPPEVGDIIEFGGYNWLVLEVWEGGRFERHRVLIITEEIISRQRFDRNRRGRFVRWSDSDIRQYLNNDFYGRFTEQERRRISYTFVLNENDPWTTQLGSWGDDTRDKIFLLSVRQVVRYFGNSGQLVAGPNHPDNTSVGFHDQYSSYRIAHSADGVPFTIGWWLRSTGIHTASLVESDGFLRVRGLSADDSWGGVRPALWLYL